MINSGLRPVFFTPNLQQFDYISGLDIYLYVIFNNIVGNYVIYTFAVII